MKASEKNYMMPFKGEAMDCSYIYRILGRSLELYLMIL